MDRAIGMYTPAKQEYNAGIGRRHSMRHIYPDEIAGLRLEVYLEIIKCVFEATLSRSVKTYLTDCFHEFHTKIKSPREKTKTKNFTYRKIAWIWSVKCE